MNFQAVLITIILAAFNVKQGHGARILGFFPMPVKSHHRVFQPLLRGLAERGHQITYFTPFPMKNPPSNMEQITVKDYLPFIFEQHENLPDILQGLLVVMMGEFGESLSTKVMQDESFKNLINSTSEFDLLLSEMSVLHEAFSPLVHRFNTHSVEILPSGNLHWSWFLHGNPYDTSYIIDTSLTYTDHMSFMARVHNTVNSLLHKFIMHYWYLPRYQDIADTYFRYTGWERRPPIKELITNTSLVLVNSHFSLNYPYPLAANFRDVGGINLQPEPTSLTQELKEFMDGAPDGVIYFTLGSHAEVSRILTGDLKDTFLTVLSSLKQRVLWKWEDNFPELQGSKSYQNIKISKWFPQQDILAHKNLKFFITHGGFLSMTEAIFNGVPMIAIPLMGDQFKNANHMETFGYGIPLCLNNITVDSLTWATDQILSDKRYTENAKKRSALFRDKPETALETAVYWTEYVIRHKGAHHLKPAIANMPWYQQALLDVYLAIALIIFIPLYISRKLVDYLNSRCEKFLGKSKID